MKKNFDCPNCSATLRVEESFAGRRIKCPRCKREIEIPSFKENETRTEPEPAPEQAQPLTPEQLLDESDAASDVTDVPVPQDTTFVGVPGPTDPESFDLSSDVVTEPKRFEPPGPSPDEPMLKNFPDFIPNPFVISYPLDQNLEGVDDVEEEAEALVNSKMPSVDELIN